MAANIQLFQFQGQDVRVVWEANEPWPIFADTCKCLGISNPSDMLKRILFSDGVSQREVIDRLGRPQTVTIISLPNYLDFVARSDAKNAVPFREWVFGEVLPAIFKTGSYSVHGDINFNGYDNIKHLDLQDKAELLRQAIQFYEDLMLSCKEKHVFLRGLEKENFPGNTFTRGRRKTLDVELYLRQVADRYQFGFKVVGEEIVIQKSFWGQDRAI